MFFGFVGWNGGTTQTLPSYSPLQQQIAPLYIDGVDNGDNKHAGFAYVRVDEPMVAHCMHNHGYRRDRRRGKESDAAFHSGNAWWTINSRSDEINIYQIFCYVTGRSQPTRGRCMTTPYIRCKIQPIHQFIGHSRYSTTSKPH